MRFILAVSVIVVFIFSCKKSKDTPVPIDPPLAAACFTMSPKEDATLDSLIRFSNCSDSVNVNYQWDFGDGTTSNKRHETHSFSEPGQYIIKLEVSRNGEQPVIASKTINVRIKERYIDLLPVVKPTDFVEMADGSIYVIGNTSEASATKLYLSKFDKNLRLKWTKYWSDEHSATFRFLDIAVDGNLLFAGNWDEQDYSGPLRIMKTDTSGNVKWKQEYALNNGTCVDMRKSADGGIIVIAQEDAPFDESGMMIGYTSLIKFSNEGKLEWRKIYNKERIFSAGNVLPLPDGYQFAASSSSLLGCANCYDSLVIAKTDLAGKLTMQKSHLRTYDGAVGGTKMAATATQLFAAGPGPYFMLMEANGKLIKQTQKNPEYSNWVSPTPSGNFITGSGYTHWNGLLLSCYDQTGAVKWEKRLGRRNTRCFPEHGYGTHAAALRDGTLLFLGISEKDCPNDKETSMYLVKITENGDIL